MRANVDVLPVGDAAVLGVLGDEIEDATIRKVWALSRALRKTLGGSVLDIVPAFGSVLVRFDPGAVELALVMAAVRGAAETLESAGFSGNALRTIDVGVCFAPEYALDLQDVAAQAGMPLDEVVSEFCGQIYHVAFLGFTAGFPYLVGLSERLKLPRLATPRVRVPAGSVAIAAGQCGIYPRMSPGGWRILGKTSASIFDPGREEAALFRPGDKVRFRAVPSVEQALANVA